MANWYVSQKVGSSGAGTSLAVAFKTIAEAIAASASNDIIYVYGGIYNEGDFTITKILTFVGIGYVEVNGGGVKTNFAAITQNQTFYNFKFKNFTVSTVNLYARIYTFINCEVTYLKSVAGVGQTVYLDGCICKGDIGNATYKIVLHAQKTLFTANLYIDFNNVSYFKYNIFKGSTIYSKSDFTFPFAYNNFYLSSKIGFLEGAPSTINSVSDIQNKYIADGGINSPDFTTNEFYTPSFINEEKNNYSQNYNNNPIAFAGFLGQAMGPLQAAANIICKETSSSGNCDIYDISADAYSLGLFGGITNVGAIDNANEKLYRTSDGANNWGVFVASTDLPRSHIIKNLQMFGTIIDRNGGQVSETPGDFAYNFQIDVLVKWSATLSKATLLADTSIPFVRFRLRPNEYNYYVDNSGTLVGDGDPGYAALVSSADGGAGALPPQKIVGKSFVAIIILQDA